MPVSRLGLMLGPQHDTTHEKTDPMSTMRLSEPA